MPRVSSLTVVQKRPDGEYDVLVSPPEFVKAKFALFLKAYPKNEWDRSKTCEAVGILPGQFHRWIKKYPALKKRLEICEEGAKDWGEKRLKDFMRMDNKVGMVATIFYLKTKCQDRGYSEQIQFSGVVENRYPKEMMDAVANAAKYGNSRPTISVTPNTKRLTSGEDE
mgnify:CR=1 FL=1